MENNIRIAIAQMCSADSHAPNIETMRALTVEAKGQGADMLALPEVSGLMNANRAVSQTQVVAAEDDPFIAACREEAAKQGIWIHSGSTPVLAPDGRFFNQSSLIDPSGDIRATYNKVHLFDVDVPGATFKESKAFAPGDAAVLAETPWGPMGLTICYDMRFPHLHRTLAEGGARVIFSPAAFTVPTGRAHWHVLLRSRAIETGAYVIAPAQAGHHADGRETYGHSLAVDPWGKVIVDLEHGAPKLEVVELDLTRVEKTRAQIPNLANKRDAPLRRV
ncbi:carbon-nitrogen hydrolase family protein [Gymnodinialimonas hymeniacidonis]|uniref:carbon-nitrogen hydrolase family protein n=1 Tax=Gymnodinialimonas hymeniacidonis TaxID=3126508 RepID=UPI0034C678E0